MSQQNPATIDGLKMFFEHIYYEAKDVEHPFVKLMPIGLTEFYIRGNEDSFWSGIHSQSEKTDMVLAAWGKWWPELNQRLPDRSNAYMFALSSPIVTHGIFPADEYYRRLAQSHFMLCPRGDGIQAPKLIEALLMSCIPIMTDHIAARELADRGMPIAIIQNWNNITLEFLNQQMELLLPKIDAFKQKILSLNEWWAFSFP